MTLPPSFNGGAAPAQAPRPPPNAKVKNNHANCGDKIVLSPQFFVSVISPCQKPPKLIHPHATE